MTRLPPHQNERYPSLRAALKFRRAVVWGGTLLAITLGIYLALRMGSVEWAMFGLLLAALVFGALKLLMEVLDLIADMLLPR